MLSAVGSKEVSGSSARRQYTENCAKSPTGKETGRDKFDHVVANSQTDVKTFFFHTGRLSAGQMSWYTV